MKTVSLRQWWEDRVADISMRWEVDIGFRRSFSLLVTAITLTLVGMCLIATVLVAHQVAPQWFGGAPGGANPGAAHGGDATFPVAPLRPMPTAADLAPVAVATSPLGPLTQPTPTPASSPLPTATATATPFTVNTPTCAPLTQPPILGGRTVQDGTAPTPLQGGCPAQLIIHASTHPDAPIAVVLTFGHLDPIGCTITFTGTTDGVGNAALAFTVPGNQCFHGTILTSGTITVGSDNSANTTFAADA
ncbi:MAG: hypothetical protein H0X24_05675 [Ktedonobacterales bacterium]|nr:hypothetical protein [Ktedonobacterales bacterium]